MEIKFSKIRKFYTKNFGGNSILNIIEYLENNYSKYFI